MRNVTESAPTNMQHQDTAHSVAPSIFLTEDQMLKFWWHVDRRGWNECWNWTGPTATKQYRGVMRVNGKPMYAYRISYILFVKHPEEGMFILHKCDNPKCVNPRHLKEGTALDNVRDMDVKGRRISVRGDDKATRMTSKEILEIRAKYNPGIYGMNRLSKRVWNIQRICVANYTQKMLGFCLAAVRRVRRPWVSSSGTT